MLIALFTLLATVVFGSGDASPFIIPKVEKRIKQTVTDKERKDEMLATIKAYKKEWKALQKVEKKQAKAIHKMNKDRNTDHQALVDAFEKSRDQRYELHKKLIDGRLKAQEILTSEEWESIMTKALDVKPKQGKKMDKAEAKAGMRQDKKLTAIAEEIEAAFADPAKRKKANEDLEKFEESLTEYLVEFQEYPSRAIEVMRDGRASREEIAEVVESLEDYRGQVHGSFLTLRKDLVVLSTEEEWPKIAKALGKFF